MKRYFRGLGLLCPLLLSILSANSYPAQTASTSASRALSAGTRFTVTGKEEVPLTSLRLQAGSVANSPYVLPRLPKRPYNEQAIESTLSDLFSKWAPARTQYAGYFILMPQGFDIKAEAVSLPAMSSLPDDTVAILQHWNLSNYPTVGLSLLKPSTLATAPPFAPGQPAGATSGPDDRIYVKLDGFGSGGKAAGGAVPIATARIVEADFIRGLVTRLFLDAYITAGKNYQGAGGLSTVSLEFGQINPTPGVFAPYTAAASYPAGQTFQSDLSAIGQSNPVAPVSLLYGWGAASKLLKDDSATHALRNDVWQLLSYRYSPEQIGAMVGFTLNYLAGVAENNRVVALSKGQPDPGSTSDAGKIVAQAANDPNVSAAKKLVASFANILTAEFYAAAQNTKLSNSDRTTLLTRYSNLIDGYRRGVNIATNDIYNEMADIAYGIGYANGFNDGYAVGYAAGWADGFVAGNAAAWAAANAIISNLQSQISTLQTQLNNANSSGGGGGFWNTVGQIVSIGSTIIGGIASLF